MLSLEQKRQDNCQTTEIQMNTKKDSRNNCTHLILKSAIFLNIKSFNALWKYSMSKEVQIILKNKYLIFISL